MNIDKTEHLLSPDEEVQFHPLIEAFPLMGKDDFARLLEDIELCGQQQPVIFFEGKVLDGRNRVNACRELGMHTEYQEFAGTEEDAFKFVMSANLHRRQLNSSQKAMVALDILPRIDEVREEKRIEKIKNKAKTRKEEAVWEEPDATDDVREERVKRIAADILRVNERFIDGAADLKEQSEETAREVFAGDLSLSKAVKQLNPETEEERIEAEYKALRRGIKTLINKAGNFPDVAQQLERLFVELEVLDRKNAAQQEVGGNVGQESASEEPNQEV